MMIVPGDPSDTVYYFHADHLGKVFGLTNNAWAWTEKYASTLYGKPAEPSTVGNPFMYTGRRFDTETGLYYYRARYLDSKLRRFIQPDPIGYLGGLNLYAYVQNNPVNILDPYGEPALAVAAPIAGLAALVDGPLPFGETIGAVILAGVRIFDLYMLSEGWMSPEEAARQRANDILKEKNLRVVEVKVTDLEGREICIMILHLN